VLAAAEGNETLEDDATSRRDPVRMRSEFSLKRCSIVVRVEFAGFEEAKDFGGSAERITERRPTVIAFDCGTMTRKPLETMRIMK